MMRKFKSLLMMTVAFGFVVTVGARSFAGPLLPSFPAVWNLGDMVAGQSKLVNPHNPTGDYINVDWIVRYDDGAWGYLGAFVYMYQLENTAGSTGITNFNVSYMGAKAYLIEKGTVLKDLDSDDTKWLGHGVGNFANLGPETEPGGVPSGLLIIPIHPDDNSVTFVTLPPIALTHESWVLYIIDPRPPVYGEARAHDGTTWWGKVTFMGVTYGDPVPVPSPEPGAAMLLITGLMGTLVWRYRRK